MTYSYSCVHGPKTASAPSTGGHGPSFHFRKQRSTPCWPPLDELALVVLEVVVLDVLLVVLEVELELVVLLVVLEEDVVVPLAVVAPPPPAPPALSITTSPHAVAVASADATPALARMRRASAARKDARSFIFTLATNKKGPKLHPCSTMPPAWRAYNQKIGAAGDPGVAPRDVAIHAMLVRAAEHR